MDEKILSLVRNLSSLKKFLTKKHYSIIMCISAKDAEKSRSVAQFGSAPALGAGCRGFESLHSDHFYL